MKNTTRPWIKSSPYVKGGAFVYAGSEIYGGLSNTGLRASGVEYKNNVKRAWWKKFVQESPTTWAWTAPSL
jgi:glycyl-tRNA synthetase